MTPRRPLHAVLDSLLMVRVALTVALMLVACSGVTPSPRATAPNTPPATHSPLPSTGGPTASAYESPELAASTLLPSPIPTARATTPALAVDADLVGVFVLGPGFGSGWDVDGCPMLVADGTRYVVLYPEGWTIRPGPGRIGIELHSPAGVVYARGGDLVAVNGVADGEAHFDCTGTVIRASRVVATSLPFDEGMIATPSTVAAGELVEVTFRRSTDRGLAYVLERERDGSWEAAFQLISDQRGGPPLWRPADDKFDVDLVGISGLGPDRVLIPPPAPSGSYRLCVWWAPSCVPVTVTP